MTEAPKPTKVDKLKEAQKAWKAGVRAVAKFKFISPEEKSELLTRFDEQFKAAIAEEKAKLKAKAKKKR
ncbi:MAG: hypothetical protein ACTSVD_06270 [Candidatus Thorarchaeota archaeon]|nr:MAG: hypothetical protein DRO73_09915 [Candidatus Thorarchaeota archaeon]RLI61242.1 MAG: hypothetical protein DRO93_04885 [Candidatus Thorarchaeota archaeon]